MVYVLRAGYCTSGPFYKATTLARVAYSFILPFCTLFCIIRLQVHNNSLVDLGAMSQLVGL